MVGARESLSLVPTICPWVAEDGLTSESPDNVYFWYIFNMRGFDNHIETAGTIRTPAKNAFKVRFTVLCKTQDRYFENLKLLLPIFNLSNSDRYVRGFIGGLQT